MKKILLASLLALLLLVPRAEALTSARLTKTTYAYKRPSTVSAYVKVKKDTHVYIIKNSGNFYYVYNARKTTKAYILKKYVHTLNSSWKAKVEKSTWSRVNTLWRLNQYAYLYDTDSGETIYVKRLGGTNHADIEPATQVETNKLKRLYGLSWNTHPVILQINGRYIAASINTMPHGRQSIMDNGFNGQFCLHTVGSKTHDTNVIQKEHQKSINKAYKWAH